MGRVKNKNSTITEPQAVAVAEEHDVTLVHNNSFPEFVTLIHPGIVALAGHVFHVKKRLGLLGVDDGEKT